MLNKFATSINILQSLTTISLLIGFIGIVSGIFSFFRFNNYKQTLRLQNDNIAAQTKLLETHKNEIRDLQTEVSMLKARNTTLETVPLGEILHELTLIHKAVIQVLSNQKSTLGD